MEAADSALSKFGSGVAMKSPATLSGPRALPPSDGIARVDFSGGSCLAGATSPEPRDCAKPSPASTPGVLDCGRPLNHLALVALGAPADGGRCTQCARAEALQP